MSFDSLAYLIFLPLVWLAYLGLRTRSQNLLLLAASYLFYGWWDVRFLFLIILSTSIDYLCGLAIGNGRVSQRQGLISISALGGGLLLFVLVPGLLTATPAAGPLPMEALWAVMAVIAVATVGPLLYRYSLRLPEPSRKRLFVVASIVANLGILGVFKYFDFFVSSAEDLARAMGVADVALLHLNIVLPVGISFYTFQTLSYTIGVYRGEVKPTSDFLAFSLFVAFFPQLVAGPIERASHLLPSILNQRRITGVDIGAGLFLILLGLFKKVGIANGLAGSVDSVYGTAGAVSTVDVVLATVCFALQIYCDFSGYSDIARGSSRLFGIELMTNFAQPYFSRNPSEFWRRWHISLSTWLRDYLYIPLGGNRGGSGRTYRNLTLTMLLGGLWHGASWNFVLWGAYQGTALSVHRFISQKSRGWLSGRVGTLICVGVFFTITCYGWLLFRAESLGQIVEFTRVLVFDWSTSYSMKRPTFSAILGVPILLVIDFYIHRSSDPYLVRLLTPLRGATYAALLFVVLMGLSNDPAQFIYFQF